MSNRIQISIRIHSGNKEYTNKLQSISRNESDTITAFLFNWYGRTDVLMISMYGKIKKETAQLIKQAQTACVCNH